MIENSKEKEIGKVYEYEKVPLTKQKMLDIKSLLYDLIRECIGKRSFDKIRYLIGDERVDNLNDYFGNFLSKKLTEFQKKIGCLVFYNEKEDFSIKIVVNKGETIGIENSKGI